MAEDNPDDKNRPTPLKERLKDVGKKVGDASKKAAKKTTDASKKVAEKTTEVGGKLAKDIKSSAQKLGTSVGKKREERKVKKEEKKAARAKPDTDEYDNTDSELVTLTKSEYDDLVALSKGKNKAKEGEMSRAISDIQSTLTMTILFAALLFGIDRYIESNPLYIWNVSAELLIWPVGTSLWSYFVLHKLAKSRTFLSMSFGMRVQTSIGIGLGTELVLILTSETVAITHIWGWTAVVALTAILLSGIVRAIVGFFYRLFGKKRVDET